MPARFTPPILEEIHRRRTFGIRAGARRHRFTAIWVVVAEGRVFARSWDGKEGGWFDALLDDPRGVLQVGDRELRFRAARTRSERLRDAVDAAYRAKYTSAGSLKYVRGFARPERRERTVEILLT
jgi:hypothetical protein